MYRGTEFFVFKSAHSQPMVLALVILWEEEIPSAGAYWICLSIKML